jgi:hypothetical protein
MPAGKKSRKAKKPVEKKPGAKRSRRAFGFETDEAQIRLIRFRGKKRVIRLLGEWYRTWPEGKPDGVRVFTPLPSLKAKALARKQFIQQKIFHELFPKNSIVPVGIAMVKEKGQTYWGTVSEILRNRSEDYKLYQRILYLHHLPTDLERAMASRHSDFAWKIGRPRASEILEQTGIALNPALVNICNVKGKPVFFEITTVNPDKLKKYIQSNVKDKKTRQMLLRLRKKLARYQWF